MLFEYLNLKKTPYCLEKITSEEFVELPKNKFEVNNSLIILSSSPSKTTVFSYLLSAIFRFSLKDYNKYIKNFSTQLFIPESLLHYNVIIAKRNLPRISKKKYCPSLQLVITQNCNLRCLYCFARSGRRSNNVVMPFQIAKAAIDFMAEHNKKRLNLKFIGAGENTTQFPLLKKIVSYARKRIQEVTINPVSTNGVFSQEVADWLIKNVQRIQLSCDGPAFIQNKYRPLASGGGSSRYVEKTMKYFIKKGKDFRVRVTMVNAFFGNELKIVNYFWQLGVQKINFGPLELIGEAKKKLVNIKGLPSASRNFNSLFKEFKKLAELQNELELPINVLNFGLLGSTVTCAIYNKSLFVVGPYGNVSACDRYTGPSDLEENSFLKDLLIGKYDTKSKKIKVDFSKQDSLVKIINNQLKVNKCNTCPLLSACSTICLYNLGHKYGTINPKKSSCHKTEQQSVTTVFDYLYQRYFVNKKPCLMIKNNKLYLSLLYTDFELGITKNGKKLAKNPYITIDQLSILPRLLKKMIDYKNKREELTVFLLKFQLEDNNYNLANSRKVIQFFKALNSNHVYIKITEPPPQNLLGQNYEDICQDFNIPLNYRDSLDLYFVKDNIVFFSKNKRGRKKFSEYKDREEIYQDFIKIFKS